jgi:hypothetical protein
MSGKTIYDGSVKTQSVQAVKSLLTWRGRAVDPMPSHIQFAHEGEEGRLVLVLSNKRDSYYVVTAKVCSCPAQTFTPGQPCKHRRQHFPQLAKRSRVESAGSLRPDMAGFRPIATLPGEEKAVKASLSLSPSMLIDLHDTTDREAAYFSIKEDRVLWPAEA